MTIYYRLPEVCPESTYRLESKWPLGDVNNRDMIAEECAEDYVSFHDGWELNDWPQEISLHETEEGPEVARFSVNMEMAPHFSATLKPPEEIEDAPTDSGAD